MNYSAPLTTARTTHLPIHLWTAGENHEQENRDRPNGAVFHHLFFVMDGELLLRTAEGETIYPAGTALFLPKDTPMFYKAAKGHLITGWLTFDGYGVNELLTYFNIKGVCFAPSESLIPQYELCVKATRKGKSHEKISALLYPLLISFFSLSTTNSDYLKQAYSFIKEHATRDISVPEIAEAVGISQSLLYRLFRQENLTPLSYLQTYRIEMAQRQLLDGNDSIAQIGNDCGFHDQAYFCKVFRRLVGMTPTEFRNQYC